MDRHLNAPIKKDKKSQYSDLLEFLAVKKHIC